MVKNMARIKEADALAPEPLMLVDEKSLWGADVYIAVSKEMPGATMERISMRGWTIPLLPPVTTVSSLSGTAVRIALK